MFPTRQIVISSQNEGPVVNIAAWISMVFMISCVATRVVSKYLVVRRLTLDDGMIGVTLVLAILHTYILSMLVVNGLGRPQRTLSNGTIEHFEQYAYVSQLLYIPTLCLAKLSTLAYLRALSPETPYARLNLGIEVFVILWALAAEFAIAFQCPLPSTWAILNPKCFDILPFWNTIGALDVVTDLAIVALPAYLVWSLQMSRSKKTLVIAMFGTRIFIIPLTVMRMYFYNTISSPSLPDQTLTSYHGYLATTIQMNVAVIVACLPFLKPFLESMSSSGFSAAIRAMDNSYATTSKPSKFGSTLSTFVSSKSGRAASMPTEAYNMGALVPAPKVPRTELRRFSTPQMKGARSAKHHGASPSWYMGWSGSQGDLGTLRPDKVRNFSHVSVSTPEERSIRDSNGSDKMIIKRTDAWEVRESYEAVDEISPIEDPRVRYKSPV